MIYSKFTDNKEDNEETLVSPSSAPASASTPVVAPNMNGTLNINPNTQSHILSSTPQTLATSLQSEGPAVFIPHINRTHLKTLDTCILERNMQVRHDLMVDEGYRASLPKLEISEESEELYWISIKIEVAELISQSTNDAPRLRALIHEIREMIIDLYPRCDLVVGEFSEYLEDTAFVIQQIKIGSLDIQGFFKFLGHVMKKNCAPKRDVLVDSMINCECPIEGLKAALKLIELMKLDLANFKLDQLRPIIAKTAVSTERGFFSQLFANGKLSLDLTRKWYKGHASEIENKESSYAIFISAGVQLLITPFVKNSSSVPETFILDKKRLISFHGKFQDLCIVQCLLLIFKKASSCKSLTGCFAANLLKRELLRLLEKADTQISDISTLIVNTLKEIHVKHIDFDYIHSALNKIISPENELFQMVEGKLVKRIKSKLSCAKASNNSNEGLSDLNVLDEVDSLTSKFGILLQFNWSIFEPIYQNIHDNAN
jgi:hypothetical protein